MNWAQIQAMLWLRWRLSRNQWGRGGQVNAVITFVLVIMGLAVAVVGGVGGLLAGALALGTVEPLTLMLVWDGLTGVFLFLWMIGLVTELQRSELIDLGRLLHLPVSLRDVFLLNYLASHLSMGLALLAPAMLGVSVGLVVGRGVRNLLLVPLVVAFFFMITAWTYCVRGWLAALMVNPRRRRSIVMGVTLAFILLAQLPNLATQMWIKRPALQPGKSSSAQQEQARYRREREALMTTWLKRAHLFVPILWLPCGAKALAENRVGPALLGAGGMLALGALGLWRAYLGTLAFYRSQNGKKPTRALVIRQAAATGGKLLVERQLPVVPEESAAMALTSFRSMMRAPEVKMALAANVFIFGMIGASAVLGGSVEIPPAARPFMASAAVLVTFLGLAQVLFNQFGFDREGFRSLVLVPAARWHVLLGKNLALLPLGLGVFLVLLTLLTILGHLPVFAVSAACLQFGAAFLAMSSLGNWTSIVVPYRVASGSLKPTKTKAITMLLMMGVNLLIPLGLLPVLVPAGVGALCEHLGWCPAPPVTLTGSALLLAVSALVYWRTLQPLGSLLERRERRILQVVTTEVE